MINGTDVAWSCVIDDTPEIWASIVPWLVTAIELARISPSHIHIHHVCALKPDIAKLCRSLAVNTHKIEPFDPRYPHVNKIQQCATAFTGASKVVLTDVDIVFAGKPPLEKINSSVAGKLVDQPNPPMEILRKVFTASGVGLPITCMNAYIDSKNERVLFETFLGNFNGGVYVIDRKIMDQIGRTWAYWARWLIARIDLLDRWTLHVDQVSFCMAVSELGVAAGQLDESWNFPLHLNVDSGGIEPFILHHHAMFDDQHLLRHPSLSRASQAIARVNSVIETFHAGRFSV